jgi:hypothetical protein
MLVDAGLTFHEIVTNDPLPKGTIEQAIVDFLTGREDAAIFGDMAVNAYVDERRMTEDVDIVSPRARVLADELRQRLNEQFHIAVRVREIGGETGFRIYQIAKPKNRHLAAVRAVESLPPSDRIAGVSIVTPPEVIVGKVFSCARRKGKPKSFTDRRDLAHMLLRYPELKVEQGVVRQRLEERGAGEDVLQFWQQLVAEEIIAEDDDDEFE